MTILQVLRMQHRGKSLRSREDQRKQPQQWQQERTPCCHHCPQLSHAHEQPFLLLPVQQLLRLHNGEISERMKDRGGWKEIRGICFIQHIFPLDTHVREMIRFSNFKQPFLDVSTTLTQTDQSWTMLSPFLLLLLSNPCLLEIGS